MAKTLDITKRLKWDERPRLKVKDVEVEVNNSAETVIRVMELTAKGGLNNQGVLEMMNLLISVEDQQRLLALGMSFRDYAEIMMAAMDLVTDGDEEDQGEGETRTTT